MHLHPKPGEILSSWIVRLAHAHGLKAQTFSRMVFGSGGGFWNRDVDKLAPAALLAELCRITGVDREVVEGTTLRSYEGIFYQTHTPFGNTRWLLPLGIYHRTHKRRGLVYCPLCLREDEDPFFRKSWRLAFNTICERHGTQMLDRCSVCGHGIAFFRRELGDRNKIDGGCIALCHHCGYDLRCGPAYDPVAPDGQSLMALRSALAFHDMGWWFSGHDTISYSHLFYDGLHILLRYLTSKYGRKALQCIEAEIGKSHLSGHSFAQMPFEQRELDHRHWLIAITFWLLQDWPERFVSVLSKARSSRTRMNACEPTPWWLERVLRENLSRPSYVLSSEEIESAARYLRASGSDASAGEISRLMGVRRLPAARISF